MSCCRTLNSPMLRTCFSTVRSSSASCACFASDSATAACASADGGSGSAGRFRLPLALVAPSARRLVPFPLAIAPHALAECWRHPGLSCSSRLVRKQFPASKNSQLVEEIGLVRVAKMPLLGSQYEDVCFELSAMWALGERWCQRPTRAGGATRSHTLALARLLLHRCRELHL